MVCSETVTKQIHPPGSIKLTWINNLDRYIHVYIHISRCLKVGLGFFDFCTHSRRLISKDSISSPNFSSGCSYAERALWCRDSKRRALGNYFPVRIY